jgi:hypothetical protein
MRKVIVTALVVFALAFAIGAYTPTVAQAGTCYYTCSCTGTPLYCCVNNGVTTCKFTTKIRCLDIITC